MDLDHGKETDYVRALREELERELAGVYGTRVKLDITARRVPHSLHRDPLPG